MFTNNEFVGIFENFFTATEPCPWDSLESLEDCGHVEFSTATTARITDMFRAFCAECGRHGVNPCAENVIHVASDCLATWQGNRMAFFGEDVDDLRDYAQSPQVMAACARQCFRRTPITINQQGEIEI